MSKSGSSSKGSTWDELEKQLFTSKEIEESKERVFIINEIIKAREENENKPVPALEYKGYTGSIEFSEEDNLFFGKVMGIRSLLSYEGKDIDELTEDFQGAIDDYLNLCKKIGLEPEKAEGVNEHEKLL